MRLLHATLFLLLLCTSTMASATDDDKANLKGQIIDEGTSEPIEFATVSVFQHADSSLVTGGITNGDGSFQFNVGPGEYYLKIQFVSYDTKLIDHVTVSREEGAILGLIKMQEASMRLDDLVIEGEKTQMELTLDKKVYNIGKDLSNLGGTTADILNNLPAVSVDLDGNISLRGSQNVRVLIDGKPSGLVGLSSADALRQLQGNLVERVEVITNPSARYDAEGLAGVINIVLKKEKRKGMNGSYQVNTGFPNNHGASVNMNYRSQRVNWFTNLGLNYRKSPGQGASYQEFNLSDTSFATDRVREHLRGGISYSARFGGDFFLNDQNTLTLAFLYRYADEDNNTDLRYLDYEQGGSLFQRTLRNDDEFEGDENLEYSLNYTKKFDRKGQKFTFDIQYQNNNEIEGSDLTETARPIIGEPFQLLQHSNNDEGERRLMIQSDYIQPVSQNGNIEAGFRLTERIVRNDYLVEEQNEDGVYESLANFSNDFVYKEEIGAGYVIYADKINDLSFQAGTRVEFSDIRTELKQTDSTNRQRYYNFFPSINLTYKLDKINSIQASYSRRISRPRFWYLNPFTSFSDARNIRAGNPNLQPEFTDSYELGLLQNFERSSLYYSVYYRHTDGETQRISSVDSAGVTYSIPQNLAKSDAIGIEMNANREMLSWWQLNANINFYHYSLKAPADRKELSAKTVTLTSRISNILNFNPQTSGQVNFWYRAPERTSQGKRLSMSSVDIGISRDVLNNNGTISFNVTDLFNTRVWRSKTRGDTFYSENEFQWRARQFTMAFVYRLNQKKQRYRRGDRGGNDFMGGGGFTP